MNHLRSRLARAGIAALAIAMTSGFIFPKKYKQPEAGQPAAVLTIAKPQSEAEQPSPTDPTRYFSAYDNPDCEKRGRGGFLGTLMYLQDSMLNGVLGLENESRKAFRVVVDEPLYLMVKAQVVLDSRSRAFKAKSCRNMVTFTPLDGHRYEAQQLATDARCLLIVTDEETGRVPDDFAMVPIAGKCHDD